METDEIQQTLDNLNRAWRDQRFEDLSRFFDDNIVMKGPGLKELGRGREALVQSYVEFMKQSSIMDYSESNYSIHSWSGAAAASYDWAMTYEQNGKTHQESGQHMFVFVRRKSRWLAVLRMMLF